MIKYIEEGQKLYDEIVIKRTLNKEKENCFAKNIVKDLRIPQTILSIQTFYFRL